MPEQRLKAGAFAALLLTVALLSGFFVSGTDAQLTGDYTIFSRCPWRNLEVKKCFYSVGSGGEVAIGDIHMVLSKSIVIQGGFAEQGEDGFAHLVAPAEGPAISKTKQPIPGGVKALLPANPSSPLLKALVHALDGDLNELSATLEAAGPPGGALFNENNLGAEEGPGLVLPAKVHLENKVLGKRCYVGSDSAPLMLELTVGVTNPPSPNLPIRGHLGELEFFEEGRILKAPAAELVDNAWAAPRATGCGGPLAFLLNPAINREMGLPSPAGHNSAILNSATTIAAAAAVRRNDAENP